MSYFKQFAKLMLQRWAPDLADRIQSKRDDEVIRRKNMESGLAALEQRFLDQYGPRIVGGVFTGMNYLSEAKGSVLIPKLLGTYEREITPWIRDLVAMRPTKIIDIGCAEGYYAVGLACLLKDVQIFAFDISVSAQSLCKQLAELNGVSERVQVAGRCSAADLEGLAGPGTVVICDIEGAEGLLLDPRAVPRLIQSTLIVELHDCLVPGVSEVVCSRFSATHALDEAKAEERSGLSLSALAGFIQTEQALMLSEHRVPGQSWVRLRPLTADH